MASTRYNEKRNFDESPEPAGGSPDIDRLRFVIRKHAAARLLHDSRLDIHIYIPFEGQNTQEQTKEFARIIAASGQREFPDYTSLEGIVKARNGKMSIDLLQNRAQAAVAAAQSVRPKPKATVSMPLHWDEVKKRLRRNVFTIYNALHSIKSEGDIFKPV